PGVDRVEQHAPEPPDEVVGEARRAPEGVEVARRVRRDLDELMVAEHLERGLVGALGEAVAEQVELAQDAEGLAPEQMRAADRAEPFGVERRPRPDRREEPLELDRRLLAQVLRVELGIQPLEHTGEVDDVLDEVAEVPRLERTLAPVVAGQALVELDAEELADE